MRVLFVVCYRVCQLYEACGILVEVVESQVLRLEDLLLVWRARVFEHDPVDVLQLDFLNDLLGDPEAESQQHNRQRPNSADEHHTLHQRDVPSVPIVYENGGRKKWAQRRGHLVGDLSGSVHILSIRPDDGSRPRGLQARVPEPIVNRPSEVQKVSCANGGLREANHVDQETQDAHEARHYPDRLDTKVVDKQSARGNADKSSGHSIQRQHVANLDRVIVGEDQHVWRQSLKPHALFENVGYHLRKHDAIDIAIVQRTNSFKPFLGVGNDALLLGPARSHLLGDRRRHGHRAVATAAPAAASCQLPAHVAAAAVRGGPADMRRPHTKRARCLMWITPSHT
mmetsp:Transcript_25145/g.70715  ORF Transcript_25145/g.70715 Transcript_25145/m.70715 type:complete len:340 (+) Transcript_25145:1589-2608(+)